MLIDSSHYQPCAHCGAHYEVIVTKKVDTEDKHAKTGAATLAPQLHGGNHLESTASQRERGPVAPSNGGKDARPVIRQAAYRGG
jgi:hypothetical protein